jgi:hypothetical protein
LKSIDLFSSESRKRVIVVLLIIVLGILMAARKQFITNFGEICCSYEWSIIEGNEKKLGHLHPLFRKDAFKPPSLSIIPYSLHYNKGFHVISAVLYWIFVIALTFLIIRQVGLSYYGSIVLVMLVLFVGNLASREIFDIPLIGPAPYLGYQNFDYRIFVIPLLLASILSAFQRRLILSGLLLGLVTIIHIKFGVRMFVLIMGCMVLWNLWGYRQAEAPDSKISFNSIASFGFCWVIQFTAILIYIQNTLRLFGEIEAPRVATPFVSRLSWIIINEPDDWLISYNLHSNVTFFGFLFLAVATITFCELIRRRTQDTKLKIMAVILTLSVSIALLFFGYGFLFEKFLIDYLPLSWSTTLMLTRGWDLLWVVVIAFTIVTFIAVMLWAEILNQKFKKFPFVIQKLFLHLAFAGFVLFNLYIFIDKKNGSIFRKLPASQLPHMKLSYTQICTEDTTLYKKTVGRLWEELAGDQNEDRFDNQLQLLENIFDRTLKSEKIEKINNPDVITLRALYHFKSNRYRVAFQELQKSNKTKESYLWKCDEQGPGLHHKLKEIPNQDFDDISQWINKNTAADRGIITPPYIPKMGMYSHRVDFYELKRDSHLMYMINGYYSIGLHRLQTLAGPYGVIMAPGIRNGRIGLRGRDYFLSLRQEDLWKIKESYPHYDYLVTENQALSGFQMLYSNPSLAVYDISKNRPLEPQFKNIPRDKPS